MTNKLFDYLNGLKDVTDEWEASKPVEWELLGVWEHGDGRITYSYRTCGSIRFIQNSNPKDLAGIVRKQKPPFVRWIVVVGSHDIGPTWSKRSAAEEFAASLPGHQNARVVKMVEEKE